MKMNTFTLGAAAGATSLMVAVPLLAQVAGAQTGESVRLLGREDMPVPTQECLTAMAGMEDSHLASVDSMIALQKQKIQARRDGLRAAALITDEAGRKAALETMREDMRTTMEARADSMPEAMTAAMEAVKTACGDTMMMHGMKGGFMGGPHGGKNVRMHIIKGDIADELGMTVEELKAAIDGGQTIHEIAEEKGIELPERRMVKKRMKGMTDTEPDTNE